MRAEAASRIVIFGRGERDERRRARRRPEGPAPTMRTLEVSVRLVLVESALRSLIWAW